ncbi:bifunctional YncE family protein/alkaline phosphatase family protein [Dictyobacter arantiisoli]|uniref:Lipoprotein n=1 Tax=Dictyobacter arantiisoli TaxID=2014874 RepID=A0A5A5TJK8_9CHLR|nr:bifunctional YncE family protein/alkaline phosphatase family protein [Dictyobacter arantiisoli]GCF11435.1 lipoprotein [Dictyobacter arantiisoli]
MRSVSPLPVGKLSRAVFTVMLVAVLATVLLFADNTIYHAALPANPKGMIHLINDWTITPAGSQTVLGDLPLNAILSPDGRYLLVANGGAGLQSLQLIATSDHTVVQSIPYTAPHSVFVGLAYSPDGKQVYAAGGGEDVIHTFTVASNGHLQVLDDISLHPAHRRAFPTGISLSPDGKRLYVANNLTNTLSVIDTATEDVLATIQVGNYPYMTLVSKDGQRIYVSNWGDASLAVIDAASGQVRTTIPVGEHPTALVLSPDAHYLYVTDADSDAISVVDTASEREVGRISVAPYAHAPLSSSPQGLALSADGKSLYVANAGNNEIVVIKLAGASGEIQGRIPTAWYPTAVSVNAANTMLYVTNGKGLGAGPNDKPTSASPVRTITSPVQRATSGYRDGYCHCSFDGFVGSMIKGLLTTLEVPGQQRLQLYTQQVARNDRKATAALNQRDPGNPIPIPGGKSPLKHVIYIIKENRTYDQVLGDEKKGNGDADLTLFPRANTPNLHALSERFGLLDNFYADAEVSADGHNWTDASNANDYVEKMWPQNYSPSPGRHRPNDFAGANAISLSPGGYLWDAAAEANLSYRDYGEFYQLHVPEPPSLLPAQQESQCAGPVAHSYLGTAIPEGQILCFAPMTLNTQVSPHLANHYDPRYKPFDLNYSDLDRVEEWKREFKQFVAQNTLPQLEIIWLPNDHTRGTAAGKLTPQSYLAQNDEAVGQLVDTVSHSKDWATTAIFITEDDAQNGPDHVDAHRTDSLVISPYTQRTQVYVDHTLYDTSAMIRTIELILGLRPLSQYDANAIPLWRLFHREAVLSSYTLQPAQVSLTERNTPNSYGAAATGQMDFADEDQIPMDQLNQILWHAIKGAHIPYPGTNGKAGKSGKANSNDPDG